MVSVAADRTVALPPVLVVAVAGCRFGWQVAEPWEQLIEVDAGVGPAHPLVVLDAVQPAGGEATGQTVN